MDLLTIQGGTPLHGEIRISGSKNAALPILIATLLTDDRCVISNVPELDDIKTVVQLLTYLGKKVDGAGDRIEVTAGSALLSQAPYDLVRRMRASIVVMGPLLARLGKVKVSLPGGCAIGGRPINIHLDGFRSLGAAIHLEQGYVELTAKKLQGGVLHLDFPSVGATENLMMAAALIPGETVINNAAREPEIVDLAGFLTSMGAKLEGVGSGTITVEGVNRLTGAEHRVIPDRIEAGTYMTAAAITRGKLLIRNMEPSHLTALTAVLRKAGVGIQEQEESVEVTGTDSLLPIGIETAVYPGFPTDLQAQWMALMSLSRGVSVITEHVFENRFMHVPELRRMGANIQIRGHAATVSGVKALSGADVMVSDLRAGAALVLAGLAAHAETRIHRIYHLDRGYESLETKLTAAGARITRTRE